MTHYNLLIKVHAGSGCNRVVSYKNGVLEINIKAPPVEGKANTELVKYLADRLKIPKSDITILRGLRSAKKVVHFENLAPEEIPPRLGFKL